MTFPVPGKRPPFMAWALRLVLCSTDPRTNQDDLVRLLTRCDAELTPDERRVAVDSAQIILSELRHSGAVLDALQAEAVPA